MLRRRKQRLSGLRGLALAQERRDSVHGVGEGSAPAPERDLAQLRVPVSGWERGPVQREHQPQCPEDPRGSWDGAEQGVEGLKSETGF